MMNTMSRRAVVEAQAIKYNIGFSDEHASGDYYMSNKGLFKGTLSIPEMLQCKYLLCLEGNDVSTGLKWMLKSNSCVLMCKPRVESWLMEGLLQPFVHYVPIHNNFDNLDEMIEWCKVNDDRCKEIAQNGSKWMEQFENNKKELRLHRAIMSWYKNNVILN
jgi:hypothetical protein